MDLSIYKTDPIFNFQIWPKKNLKYINVAHMITMKCIIPIQNIRALKTKKEKMKGTGYKWYY